jgi:hypothetical protein
MVDRVGAVGIEVPDRIVGDPGQVDHRIESLDVCGGDIAHVLA